MKHLILAALALVLLLAAPQTPAAPDTPRTLSGSYVWEQADHKGTLEAEFKPAGDLHWEVSFHFTFNGSPLTYTGTADGHLDDGALEGRVEATGRQRTFTFKGEFKGGKFTGTHADVTRGREDRTGTLTLEAGAGVSENGFRKALPATRRSR